MKTLHETFNHAASDQFEILNFHQNLGIYEPVLRLFGDRCTHKLIFQSRLWNRHDFEQPSDDLLRLDSFGLGVEVCQDAMPEYGISKGLNIFDRNVIAAINESQCLRPEDQELRCAQTGAVIHVLLHEIRRIRASGSAGAGELNSVAHDFVGDRHFANETLEFDNLRSADGFLELDLTKRRRLAHNLDFLIFR